MKFGKSAGLLALFVLPLVVAIEETKKVPSETSLARKSPSGGGGETNVFTFIRLVIFRMIYGIGSFFGLQEFMENVAGGALVPPDADTDYGLDYKDYSDDEDYGNENDDGDYEYKALGRIRDEIKGYAKVMEKTEI